MSTLGKCLGPFSVVVIPSETLQIEPVKGHIENYRVYRELCHLVFLLCSLAFIAFVH